MLSIKKMEGVYDDDLESVKVELEKVNAEYRIKSELFQNLKKSHDETLLKSEESKKKIEKQSQELMAKGEELAEVSQLVEKLESCLAEKEQSLKDLSALNEKLKVEFEQKVKTLEGENRDLGLTLSEARTRNEDLEKEVDSQRKQIEGLKSLLFVTESKCSEAVRIAQEDKELRRKDVVVGELEDEKARLEDQLKWKEEQFQHLKEAHRKLRDEFVRSEEDWGREKSALVEEACSLKTRLDFQNRASEGLRTRLEMCNLALAHEESKRRSLENIVSNFEEETSEAQMLTFQRSEGIAELRNLLGVKEIVIKESELRIEHIEKENQELRGSMKELQEAQIRFGGTGSSMKLHNKLRRLEQTHGNCSRKLEEKESELVSEIEKIREKVKSCESDLESKDEEVKKLQMELNEEIAMILEVLKSELSEAYSTAYNVKVQMEMCNMEKDENISSLTVQLEKSCCNLEASRLELKEEKRRVENLTEKLLAAQERLEQHKSNSRLGSRSGEDREILQNEKIVILEANLAAKVQEKQSLAQIVEQKDVYIENLLKDFDNLKKEFSRRELETRNLAQLESAKDYAQEKEAVFRVIAQKERRLENLKVLALSMEQDLTNLLVSSFQDLVENQVKIDALTEALKNYRCVTGVEIEEKNVRISELEGSILSLKLEIENLQVLMKCNKMETGKFVDEQRRMEGVIKKLESEKRALIRDNVKLSNENESMMAYFEKVGDTIGKFLSEDVEMMKALRKMLPGFEEKNSFYGCVGEKMDSSLSNTKKKVEASRTERSPLKEVNLMPK